MILFVVTFKSIWNLSVYQHLWISSYFLFHIDGVIYIFNELFFTAGIIIVMIAPVNNHDDPENYPY